jgi:hypothetical protein
MTFFVAEIDIYAPGQATTNPDPGYGVDSYGYLGEVDVVDSNETIRVSDAGYRTKPTDTPAVTAYPPLMAEAFAIDRQVNLDPTSDAMSASWGRVRLNNPDGVWDAIVASRNADGRAARVLMGTKTYEAARGLFAHPAYDDLAVVFTGLAQPWFLSETTLDIPLRDATYWLDRPLQSGVYGGGGGYDGNADIAGVPIPKARGGTAGEPIRNVQPVLIDPTNRIYQYNDGPGTVVTLYEKGLGGAITFQANTTNLYSGTTSSGSYRTDNSRGLFQLGATPIGTITADVTGDFPVAGAKSNVFDIARYLLTEDCAVPSTNVSTSTFTAAATAYPYIAGFYWSARQVVGVDAVGEVLASAGAKLISGRGGSLAVFVPRDVSAETPMAELNTVNAVDCIPSAPPSSVSPPPYRLRVVYKRNWTPGLPDVSAAASDAQKQFLANEFRFGMWSSGGTTYRRPSDPNPVGSGLLLQADAEAVAARLGAVWGPRRRVLAMPVSISLGAARDIGDVVKVTWPADDLRDGKNGIIVGEQFRSIDGTITLMVLV